MKSAIATIGAAVLLAPIGIALIGTSSAAHVLPIGLANVCQPSNEPIAELDGEQSSHARTIVTVGTAARVPDFGLAIALGTAMQESRLYNLDYGHLDSLGLFQQREPWGTEIERRDPVVSAHMFFAGGSAADGYAEPHLRTNQHFTLKQNPLRRVDLDEFVQLYRPESRGDRVESERWKSFTYEDLVARDKANLDLIWLKDDSLEDMDNLPSPDVIAREIVEDLTAALAEFDAVASALEEQLGQAGEVAAEQRSSRPFKPSHGV